MRSLWFAIKLCDYSVKSVGQLVTVAEFVHFGKFCLLQADRDTLLLLRPVQGTSQDFSES